MMHIFKSGTRLFVFILIITLSGLSVIIVLKNADNKDIMMTVLLAFTNTCSTIIGALYGSRTKDSTTEEPKV